MFSSHLVPRSATLARAGIVLLLAFVLMSLAGCGSTKVYTADKTIVYQNSIYNVSNVQRLSGKAEAALPNGETVSLAGKDRKAIEAMLKQHGSMVVTQSIEMDAQTMVYQRAKVEKYSDYNRMAKRFEGAQKDITKFVADKKKTQLKLK